MINLDPNFILQTFYTYCKRPAKKQHQNIYYAECPICGEGQSAGRKRRLFYFPDKQYFFCHNCNRSWTVIQWIKEVAHIPFFEILKHQTSTATSPTLTLTDILSSKTTTQDHVPNLPEICVDLEDQTQLNFYQNEYKKTIQAALEMCQQRRLFTAVNRCKHLFVCVKDIIHKDRLILPFYIKNVIETYQSRSLFPNQTPKYLTKLGKKKLFGWDQIDLNIPYVFITEGPIDSMFIKNGLAIGGITLSEQQQDQLSTLLNFEKIWIFDNDKNNIEVKKRIKKVIDQNERVFFWPKEFKNFKDINEVCCYFNIDEISIEFFIKNSYRQKAAMLRLMLL